MLRSCRDAVLADMKAQAIKSTAAVEASANALNRSRVEFLQAGLQHDWDMVATVSKSAILWKPKMTRPMPFCDKLVLGCQDIALDRCVSVLGFWSSRAFPC